MRTEVAAGDDEGVRRAADLLRAGQLVAFPTETVYGLGADATNDAAVRAIYEAKGRPAINPLIVHVLDLAGAAWLVRVDDRARRLAARFWPGPLTLVLRCRAGTPLAPSVRAELPTVAVRAPRHEVARRLLTAFGRPIAAPSANLSGQVSPTRAEHVRTQLEGRVPLILEGGRSEVGLESTVLDLSGDVPTLLRRGSITAEALAETLGDLQVSDGSPDRPTSPGQLLAHYAPSVPVRLDASACRADEAWLGFGPEAAPPGARLALNLSASGDLDEAAANLYDMLHDLDVPGIRGIAVAPIPATGVGAAINDRLRRAAAATPGEASGDARGDA